MIPEMNHRLKLWPWCIARMSLYNYWLWRSIPHYYVWNISAIFLDQCLLCLCLIRLKIFAFAGTLYGLPCLLVSFFLCIPCLFFPAISTQGTYVTVSTQQVKKKMNSLPRKIGVCLTIWLFTRDSFFFFGKKVKQISPCRVLKLFGCVAIF